MSGAWYNENNPYAAQWLRNLIAAGHIAPGDVDERSIVDVRADDLRGYSQCHFFAGIGGWSLALRLAGWPDDRPVWTGSCPCQPFSAAGTGKAADDKRHLWPRWFPLIRERRPAIVFGEQVEAAIGWGWLDAVFADLESQGYACGAAVLPACSVGAPHIRQRCWFVGHADSAGFSPLRFQPGTAEARSQRPDKPSSSRELADAAGGGVAHGRISDGSAEQHVGLVARTGGGSGVRDRTAGDIEAAPGDAGAVGLRDLADAAIARRHGQPQRPAGTNGRAAPEPGRLCDAGELGDAASAGCAWTARRPEEGRLGDAQHDGRVGDAGGAGLQERECNGRVQHGTLEPPARQAAVGGGDAGAWVDLVWLPCSDGKARPVESGTFPLAHGIPNRVGRLRAYGNAIVPQVAAEFIRATRGAP